MRFFFIGNIIQLIGNFCQSDDTNKYNDAKRSFNKSFVPLRQQFTLYIYILLRLTSNSVAQPSFNGVNPSFTVYQFTVQPRYFTVALNHTHVRMAVFLGLTVHICAVLAAYITSGALSSYMKRCHTITELSLVEEGGGESPP